MPSNRAAIYVRVSSEDQVKGSGLEVQERECKAYAARHGYEVAAVFRDDGISGTFGADARPGEIDNLNWPHLGPE
jgi:DNA invertase Pin-like site-specific DNA recombinase